jgi:hypothetical protein
MRKLVQGASGVAVVAVLMSACASGGAAPSFDTTNGDGGGSDSAAGGETGSETGADSGGESGVDSSGDATWPDAVAAVDAGLDVGSEEASDASFDTGALDAASEAASDGSVDGAPDGSCTTGPATDYCSAIPALPAAPVIDGALDCGPALVPMTPRGWNGPSALPAGNSASIAAAWRPDGLYVFVEVVTPVVIPADPGTPPYYGSGAEVYADSKAPSSSTYENPGAIQLVAAAPPTGATRAVVGEGYRNAVDQGAWSPAEFATFPTSTGFVLEAFVVAGNLGLSSWALASGGSIGFDVAVNVSYPDASTTGGQGHREGQYYLHVGATGMGAPFADPRSFCVPTLQ